MPQSLPELEFYWILLAVAAYIVIMTLAISKAVQCRPAKSWLDNLIEIDSMLKSRK